jgi:hypothetical protein
MRMRGGADLPRGRLELQRHRRFGDEIRGMRAHDVDAERLVSLGVGDDLGEALVLPPMSAFATAWNGIFPTL